LEEVIKEYEIQKEGFWNMDITGSHGDQEHVTVVISAGGAITP
jgi:hypothetical protein